jgi:3-keto-5-aminohexanoate cleavage enzyme
VRPVRLADRGKAIIEVGLNETAAKRENPHVPYGPEEVASAAIEAAHAGAAIVHFHARGPDGAQEWVAHGVYRTAMELIAQECDLLCYPTYPPRTPREERYRHVWSLADEPSTAPLELAPLDIGSRNVTLWDRERRAFAPLDLLPADHQVAINAPDELEWVLAQARTRGLHPTLGIFDVTYLRYSVHALWAGLLEPPLLMKWFLSERWASGPFPTVAGLDAYVAQVPDDVDYEGIVVPYAIFDAERCERLWRAALERGQGLRVGIGDCPDAFPRATNAELVRRAVDLLAGHGLEPATAADVRSRLGLPARGEDRAAAR